MKKLFRFLWDFIKYCWDKYEEEPYYTTDYNKKDKGRYDE